MNKALVSGLFGLALAGAALAAWGQASPSTTITAGDLSATNGQGMTPEQTNDALADAQQGDADANKIKLVECLGTKMFQDPQPEGHPPSKEECLSLLKAKGIPPSSYVPFK